RGINLEDSRDTRLLRNSYQIDVQHHHVLVLDRPQKSVIWSVAERALAKFGPCRPLECGALHDDLRRESNYPVYPANSQMAADQKLAVPVRRDRGRREGDAWKLRDVEAAQMKLPPNLWRIDLERRCVHLDAN